MTLPFYRVKVAVGAVLMIGLLALTAAGSAAAASPRRAMEPQRGSGAGAVFAMTNVSGHNRVIEYRRAGNGRLTRVGSVSTRGRGIGTDLAAQGPLRLSDDHRFLYAVNAGTDIVTTFSVRGTHLTFLQKVYAGDDPVSLTPHGNLLYVLDHSVAANGIRGFTIAANGTLIPLSDSFRALSSPIAVPGTVQFSPDGRLLLVTEKTTNLVLSPHSAIDAFAVGSDGLASAMPMRDASHGIRPFSLAFRSDGTLVVAESFDATPGLAAASSYHVAPNGTLNVVSGSVPNHQTDSCWIVITKDGRYVFTANFGSGTISSYGLSSAGELRLIDGAAASLGTSSQPVDLALSNDSHYLYLLLRGTGAVAAFAISDGGTLKPLGVVTGALPVADGASGLAAY